MEETQKTYTVGNCLPDTVEPSSDSSWLRYGSLAIMTGADSRFPSCLSPGYLPDGANRTVLRTKAPLVFTMSTWIRRRVRWLVAIPSFTPTLACEARRTTARSHDRMEGVQHHTVTNTVFRFVHGITWPRLRRACSGPPSTTLPITARNKREWAAFADHDGAVRPGSDQVA